MKAVALLVALSLMQALAYGCNSYTSLVAKPTGHGEYGNFYLCPKEFCDDKWQCRSGCCKDHECNEEGACSKKQFLVALVLNIVIGLILIAIYFILYFVYCKKKQKSISHEIERMERGSFDVRPDQ